MRQFENDYDGKIEPMNNRHYNYTLWMFFILLAVVFKVGAVDVVLPIPRTGIIDTTNTLSSQDRSSIEKKLAHVEKNESIHVAVIVIPTTGDVSIEQSAERVIEAWNTGDNRKIVILMAIKDRAIRIATDSGFSVPDDKIKLVIEATIIPKFKIGDYGAGVMRGIDQIVDLIKIHDLTESQRDISMHTGVQDKKGLSFPEFLLNRVPAIVFFAILVPLVLWITSLAHVLFSGRTIGGAKMGWLILCFFMPLIGYAAFLIITQRENPAGQRPDGVGTPT